MVQRSGRSRGSSSSSQLMGTETGAPAAGRVLNGATRVLLIGVLGVVEPDPSASAGDFPFPADQLGDGRADGP